MYQFKNYKFMVREDTPMYYMIAIINNGEAERGIRIYNTANQSILERTESNIIESIKKQGIVGYVLEH